MTGLYEHECKNLREDDVVLVPMKVVRTNDHFDKGVGMKVVCISPALDHRPREEREKGPVRLDIMSRLIHSVAVRRKRVGDWIQWADAQPWQQGKIVFIDGDEATVRLRQPLNTNQRNTVVKLSDAERILPPADLSEDEKKVMADAR